MDKDAIERSEAVRKAFLAEVVLDAKKNVNRGGEHLLLHLKTIERKYVSHLLSIDTHTHTHGEIETLYGCMHVTVSVFDFFIGFLF